MTWTLRFQNLQDTELIFTKCSIDYLSNRASALRKYKYNPNTYVYRIIAF